MEKFEKTLRIAARVSGSHFTLLDGENLPLLRQGAVIELLLSSDVIEDVKARARFSREMAIKLLDAGSRILLGVSPTMGSI